MLSLIDWLEKNDTVKTITIPSTLSDVPSSQGEAEVVALSEAAEVTPITPSSGQAPSQAVKIYSLTNEKLAAFIKTLDKSKLNLGQHIRNPLHYLLKDCKRLNFDAHHVAGEEILESRHQTDPVSLVSKDGGERNAKEIAAMLTTILNTMTNEDECVAALLAQDSKNYTALHHAFKEKFAFHRQAILPVIRLMGTLSKENQRRVLLAKNENGNTILYGIFVKFPPDILETLKECQWNLELIKNHLFDQNKLGETYFFVSLHNERKIDDENNNFPLKLLNLMTPAPEDVGKLSTRYKVGGSVLHQVVVHSKLSSAKKIKVIAKLIEFLGYETIAKSLEEHDVKTQVPLLASICKTQDLEVLLALTGTVFEKSTLKFNNKILFAAAKKALAFEFYPDTDSFVVTSIAGGGGAPSHSVVNVIKSNALQLVCQYGTMKMLQVVCFCLGPRQTALLYCNHKKAIKVAIDGKDDFKNIIEPKVILFEIYDYLESVYSRPLNVSSTQRANAYDRINHFKKILEEFNKGLDLTKLLASDNGKKAEDFEAETYSLGFFSVQGRQEYFELINRLFDCYKNFIKPYPKVREKIAAEFINFLNDMPTDNKVANLLLDRHVETDNDDRPLDHIVIEDDAQASSAPSPSGPT